jgi:pimeloyl-ACP methyl ester carboxylesterase
VQESILEKYRGVTEKIYFHKPKPFKFMLMHRYKKPSLVFLTGIILSITTLAQKDSAGYFSSFDKVRIYYEVKGTGKPVLLIHGFTGKGSDWKTKPVYDSLLANGFKVITADLRGNGSSDKPHEPEAYGNDAEAKDLMGLLKYLGIKKYTAVGYSRGSIILARLLVLDKNIERAVIGGMGADFTNPLWPRRIGIYEALMYDSIKAYDDLRKRIVSAGLDRLALAYSQKEQPSTSKEELAKVKQKVLILCGDQDEDNGKAKDLQQLIPRSQFVTVPGNHGSAAGTKEFAAAATSFLKK